MISLTKLITAASGQSSKRFIALVSLVLLIVVVVAALCGNILPEYYIITIAALCGLNQGMTLLQKEPPTDQLNPDPWGEKDP